MSYILDALQRAEAERARGDVPTLHARPVAGPPLPSTFGRQQRLGLTIAMVVVVLGIAAAGWWMFWPAASLSAPLSASVPASAPIVVVAAAAPVPPAVNVPAKPIVQTPQPVAVPAAPLTKPKPKLPVSAPQPAPSKPKAPAPAPASASAQAPVKATALAPLLSELPEATRRQIPSMTISGAVYSQNPAQRLLLVNGLVLSQGSQAAPDLTVVEIRSNSSEFNFRGTRFRMAH